MYREIRDSGAELIESGRRVHDLSALGWESAQPPDEQWELDRTYPYLGLWESFHREVRHDSLEEGDLN